MSDPISTFNKGVYEDALKNLEIKYTVKVRSTTRRGAKYHISSVWKLKKLFTKNESVETTETRASARIGSTVENDERNVVPSDRLLLLDKIIEQLAKKIYTATFKNVEKRVWPTLLPSKETSREEYNWEISSSHPTDKGDRELRSSNSIAVCQFLLDTASTGGADKDLIVLDSIHKPLFLADDSIELVIGKRKYTQYFQLTTSLISHTKSLAEVWIGQDVTASTGTGEGLAIGRCDSVDEVYYRWMGNLDLGIALGLSKDYYIQVPKKPEVPETGFMKDGLAYLLTNFPNGSEILYYKHIPVFVWKERKNRPTDPRASELTERSPDFKYRKDGKPLVKPLFEFNHRKKMKPDEALAVATGKRAAANRVMLDGLGPFMKTKQEGEKEIARDYFLNKKKKNKQQRPGQGSARAFAGYMLKNSDPDISQEWCHLFGHGDGGSEVPPNFISGSKHCNSEQLAIEGGQRLWSQGKGTTTLIAKITTYIEPLEFGVGTEEKKVFNNLLNNESHKIIDQKLDYKETDTSTIAKAIENAKFLTRKTGNIGKKGKKEKEVLIFADDFNTSYQAFKLDYKKQKNPSATWKKVIKVLEEAYLKNFYPKFMRYKILIKDSNINASTKVFDHVYNAQSQSFNYHEFQILRTTVDRLIAEAFNKREEYEERIKKKSANYEIGNDRFCRDAKFEGKVVVTNCMKVEDSDAMDKVSVDNG